MPRAAPPVDPPVLALLHRVARAYGQLMVDRMAEAGHAVTYAQSQVLGRVPEEGIRLTDLAESLGVSKQAAGQLVDSLVSEGWLVKRPHPDDARAKLVFFGPRGRESLPAAWEALAAIEADIAETVGAEGLAKLRGLLTQIVGSD